MKMSVRVLGAGVLAAAMLAGCESLPKIGKAKPAVVMVNPCEDLTVSIYFNRDSTNLTREARAALRGAAAQAEGCQFGAVDVYGLSDSVGTVEANLAVSKVRAKTVTTELAKLGFNTVNFNVVAAGETGALTESGQARPLRRRADVIFRLARAG